MLLPLLLSCCCCCWLCTCSKVQPTHSYKSPEQLLLYAAAYNSNRTGHVLHNFHSFTVRQDMITTALGPGHNKHTVRTTYSLSTCQMLPLFSSAPPPQLPFPVPPFHPRHLPHPNMHTTDRKRQTYTATKLSSACFAPSSNPPRTDDICTLTGNQPILAFLTPISLSFFLPGTECCPVSPPL